MPKYRGFMNEVSLDGLNAAFYGPRQVAYAPPPVLPAIIKPTSPYPTTVVPGVMDPARALPGIPGDIRDITARIHPGEAIVDAPDDMSAENGIPGVDDGGAFPYGDPKAKEIGPAKVTPENQALIWAALAALFLLGG